MKAKFKTKLKFNVIYELMAWPRTNNYNNIKNKTTMSVSVILSKCVDLFFF